MGSLRLTLCTVLPAAALAAVAVVAPSAHAADGGPVTVTPAGPAPGEDVTLRVGGCSGRQGSAASAAFVADAALTGEQGSLSGETRVRSTLEPGAYTVKVTCAGTVLTGSVTVARPGGATARQEEPVRLPAQSASPIAPNPAGGGGTTHFATVATSGSGPDAVQAATGLALAGIAAVAVGLRARRSRGTR